MKIVKVVRRDIISIKATKKIFSLHNITPSMYSGIDLAADHDNDTGICISNDRVELYTVRRDEEIKALCGGADITAVDAPLTKVNESFRRAERELMEVHGPLLPLNIEGMTRLSERGLRISNMIECEVVETYPRAVEKSLEIDMDMVTIDFENEDEYDAYLCALTAKFYDEGEYRTFGEGEEVIIIPETDENDPIESIKRG